MLSWLMSLHLLIAMTCFNWTHKETYRLVRHLAYCSCVTASEMDFSGHWVWVRGEVAEVQRISFLCSILPDHQNNSVHGALFACWPWAVKDFPWKPHTEWQPNDKLILQELRVFHGSNNVCLKPKTLRNVPPGTEQDLSIIWKVGNRPMQNPEMPDPNNPNWLDTGLICTDFTADFC